ncbi:putative subunit of the multisubunit Na+/H+ antiporter [Xenococcus sp. PCC 7305]|uniref:DUF4040 domain-containing protein n=1 Tax=Xenococcus sp. PCC 7305 TaxID=102125 RepID=UPI0002AC3959|nr:DUF4040 domain-containing protein [Xenococcus sp. PCC 7305]ELS00441.1 putative subunit of the multisubunit Na+/H+ antiporter [Xenococcus sp. PCC 7305]
MIDKYIYVIVALLPLTAAILLFETNPYNALILRGILGAVAALVYAVLGGADVALTEALVGTMLAVTLYVIAVRSSFVMRLGIVQEEQTISEDCFPEIIASLKTVMQKHHLRLELVEYSNSQALEQALAAKEVHAICTNNTELAPNNKISYQTKTNYQTKVRVHRLFEILQTELTSAETSLNYINISSLEEKH